ncbi:MAG: BatA domain-containing protein [Bacteroidetes bacterium]|nr:BatA domain-containing protein [Bacteroidota bacterium]
MTFLNPYVLFALVAASFPVLFHLFAQRKARRVEFSSIRFLKQLEKSSMRKVKLRQILLLILRTLLIAFLVMSFARPALRGFLGGFFGSSRANTTAIILFDNSASTSRRDASGIFFKQEQDAAIKIADALEDGDELIIVPLATIERGKAYRRLHDPQEMRKAIGEIMISDARAKLADGLRVAASELARSANVNREVYLVWDGQTRNLGDLPKSDTALRLFDERTNLFVTTVGTAAPVRNLAIDSLVAVTTVFEQGRPIEFNAYVRNTGDGAVDNAVVSLFFNDDRVAQRSVTSIDAGKTEKVALGALPKQTGILNVRAELEDDALPFDNKRYCSITLPATSHVAIFTNTASDADFMRLALEETLSESGAAPYAIEVHRLEELRMLPSLGARLDAVIVQLGATTPDASDLKALRAYLNAGHGAGIVPEPDLSLQEYNTSVAPALGLPQLVSLDGSLAATDKYSSLASFDLAHPFFAGMFDQNSNPNGRGIESPKFFRFFRFANGGVPLVKLSSGAALLSDVGVGNGHVLLFAVPATFAFSDLPRKPIFLPLIRRTAAYLASLRGRDQNIVPTYTAGDPIDISLASAAGIQSGERLLVRGPNGFAQRVEVTGSASGTMHAVVEQVPYAGIYSVFKDADAATPVAAVAVNPSTGESSVSTASQSEMNSALSRVAASKAALHTLTASGKDLAEAIRRSRFGVELWQLFLALAIVCAVAEMLIAREGKHE